MQSSLLEKPREKTANYTATMLSVALSPITHMSGTAGNEAVIMREPIMVDGEQRWVPVISGNAFRHRLFREPSVRYLVAVMNLGGQLTMEMLNFLFHGGNLTRSNGRISIARQKDLFRLFPLLRVLGCSLPDQIIPSALQCHRGILVCSENANRMPDWAKGMALKPAQSFIENYQYTRNDAKITAPELLPDEGETDSNMMIYAGQCVIPGAAFVHGFHLGRVTQIELGATLLALRLWQSEGSTIGGMAAKGHGRLDSSLHLPGVDQDACISLYQSYVEDHASESAAFLRGLFVAPDDKPKRGKKNASTD